MAPVLPVASPALLGRRKGEDAGRVSGPSLHDADRADWPLWLAAHDVGCARAAGSSFDDDFLLIRAPRRGRGLALVPQEHARARSTGRLVQVLHKPWPARFAY